MHETLLEYSNAIDWWERERLNATQACQRLQAELFKMAEDGVEDISHHHLFLENSDERRAFETKIFDKIQKLDAKFLAQTVKGAGLDLPLFNHPERASTSEGWSFWDFGKLIAGGGTAGGLAVAGSRVAPAALAAIGLGTLAAPVTVAACLAGLAFSAYSVSGQKRSDYLKVLQQEISEALTASDISTKSVLSRQIARLDAIRDIRLEKCQ